MEIPKIEEWAGSPYGFYVDRHWGGSRWTLEKGPIRLAEHHARILGHCFQLADDGRLPYDTVCLAESAKSGKTALLALVHQWFALHIEPPAEQYVISNKKDQAQSRAFKALSESVRWNPHLKRKPLKYELGFRNGTVVKAIPCNYRGESGARYTLVTFDEPWAIMYEDGVRLVSEFKPDPTRQTSCRVFAGYAGFSGESDLWAELLQTGLEGEPVPELRDIDDGRGEPSCWRNGRLFVFWSHIPRQPWQTPKWLASMETTQTPGEYNRMIHCDFSVSEESFIQPSWWDACLDPSLPPLRPGDDAAIVVAVDASQTHDWTGVVGCSRHPERHDEIAVRFVQGWDPKAQPGKVINHERTIIPTLRWLFENFNVVLCTYDEYQLAATMQSLSGLGWIRKFPQGDGSKSQPGRTLADSQLRHMILHRKIWHDGNQELRDHVLAAASRVTGDSKLRMVKKGRDPIDLGICLSMAACEIARLNV